MHNMTAPSGGKTPEAAAASCDAEPIHVPGCVQSHGVLFALDATGCIVQASDNVEALLGWPQSDVMGARPEAIVHVPEPASVAAILAAAQRGRDTCDRAWVQAKNGAHTRINFDLRAHCHQQVTFLELEPVEHQELGAKLMLGEPECTFDLLAGATDMQALLETLVVSVRRLTGFDLVMAYRFDPLWNGEVVAEAKAAHAHSYFGQKFPASDIPKQAREVFRQNWSRMICDVGAPAAALVPVCYPPTGKPTDLGRAQLRSPSPVHLLYLRNMGAGATFTISLMHGGCLWGLVACHHPAPRRLDLAHRRVCELVGRHASQRIESLECAQAKARTEALEEVTTALQGAMAQGNRVVEGLFESGVSMLELLPRHVGAGVALLYDGRWHMDGETPPLAVLHELYAWLAKRLVGSQIFVTEHLAEVYAPAAATPTGMAGLVAFSIQKHNPTVAIWCLPEVVQTIDWAGEPNKEMSFAGRCAQLHPRHSFKLWRETVRGHAMAVLPAEVKAIQDLRQALVECDLQQQVVFERAARLELQMQRRRLGVLSAATAVLSRQAELMPSMDAFAATLTPLFCDWCVVLAQHHGHMRRVALRHSTEAGQRVLASLWDMPHAPNMFGAASAEVYMPVVSDDDLNAMTSPGAHHTLVRDQLGCKSLITRRLMIRGVVMGWVAFVRDGRGAPFIPEDVPLAAELGARAASGVEKALHVETLAESLAFREQILNIVSHDLRNPLGVVWLCAEGLQRQIDKQKPNLPELATRALVKIHTACRRMDALIQDLLHLGKMEANQLTIAPTPQACRELAQESLNELELLARQSQVTLELAPAAEEALQVMCDRDRFLQVISNLVGNALKFSPPGAVATMGWHLMADGFVQFFVRDQGAGIPPEQVPHVFERFWQGGSTTSRARGAGLGLTIVKGIVEAHGGRVGVSSKVGEGSEFTFTLPVA